jgi:Ser/Thr protein kinase RdoA (MazF antagonist)
MQPGYRVMQANPGALPTLMTALGQLQGWLHSLPVEDAPGPVLDWPAALTRLDQMAEQADEADPATVRHLRDTLAAHDPGAMTMVPCHGDVTPVTVHLDPDDHHQVCLADWSEAVISDLAYDVSCTELSLWAAAYLTPSETERGLATLTRDFVIKCHRAGYRGVAGLPDSRRMKLWGAFHAARAYASPLSGSAPFKEWPPAVREEVLSQMRQDLLYRFHDLIDDLKAEAAVSARTAP